ncbi:MAG: tyrosine-type recombinase/integrase [Nitrospirales bacterium]
MDRAVRPEAWTQNPGRPIDPCNFMRIYRAAVVASKIQWVTWHDLRHTFAIRLAMQDATQGTIAALLRHSTTTLVRRYAHFSPSYLKEAVEQVSSFGKVETPDTKSGSLNDELEPFQSQP